MKENLTKLIPTRMLLSALVIASACAGGFFAAKWLTISAKAAAPIVTAPFTAEYATISHMTGQAVMTEQRTVGLRADGAEAEVFRVLVGPPMVARTIQYADGRAATLFDGLAARLSGFVALKERASRRERLVNPPVDCVWQGESLLRWDTILGPRAAVVKRVNQVGETISWRLAGFACFTVRQVSERRGPDGTLRPDLLTEPSYFLPGEPAAALFDSRIDFKEINPSELRRLLSGNRDDSPADCPTCLGVKRFEELDRKIDQAYRRAQNPSRIE